MLITGGTGLLGVELNSYFQSAFEVTSIGSKDLDIRKSNDVVDYFKRLMPDVVLHPAAIANVDLCEEDEKLAFAVNSEGAANVAKACRNIGAYMVHYSTDYVFNGDADQPYVETDPPDPVNIYGKSKLEGENRILDIMDDAAVLRVAWLYSNSPRAFINRLIKQGRKNAEAGKGKLGGEPLKVVADQIGSPTWTGEVARQTKGVIDSGLTGIFHCVTEGGCSRYEMARLIFDYLGVGVKLTECTRADFPWKAPRPRYTVLENRGLKDANLNYMRDFKTVLYEYLDKYGG